MCASENKRCRLGVVNLCLTVQQTHVKQDLYTIADFSVPNIDFYFMNLQLIVL